MAYHFLSLVSFSDDAPEGIVGETAAAARRLLEPAAREVVVAPPTRVLNLAQRVDLVIDVTLAGEDALEPFRAEPDVREFSERYLRPHAEVIHVLYDDSPVE